MTRAALDVIMPEAPAVHFIRGGEVLYAVAKRGKFEKVEHLVDQQRASVLDELTVDRESPLQLAAQACRLAVCQMVVEACVLMGIRNRKFVITWAPAGALVMVLPLDGLMAGPWQRLNGTRY